jgi:hypothetical protein
MKPSLIVAAACAALLTTMVPAAQARQKPATDRDEADLRAYRLAAATLHKVSAAAHVFAQAMQNDPKYRDAMAAGRELQALQDKENRTEAEDRRVDALEEQVEAAEKQFQALSASNDSDDSPTLDDMAHKIASIPHMSEALKSAGLTPREFATFETAVSQAGFAAGFKKAGTLKELPPGVSPENVQFVLDHETELQRIQEDMAGGAGHTPG